MRICVLISGSGSNLQALIDACVSGEIAGEIVLVVSNRKGAFGLERARSAGIETLYFPLKPFTDRGDSRETYDAALAERVAACQPHLIVLAGWMHILSRAFLDRFPRRVINLHPALPGMFAGTHAIERAFEALRAGEIAESGCMVHYAIPEVDAGDVIEQAVVPFNEEDTLAEFEARMHAAEHRIIVAAVRKLAEASRLGEKSRRQSPGGGGYRRAPRW